MSTDTTRVERDARLASHHARTVTTPTETPQRVAKGDWVVYEPSREPNRYWAARVGREFLIIDVGPDRVLMWDYEYDGLGDSCGDAVSCRAEDVRVVRSLTAARREGAVKALRAAAADDDGGWAPRTWLNERADAIEAGEDPS